MVRERKKNILKLYEVIFLPLLSSPQTKKSPPTCQQQKQITLHRAPPYTQKGAEFFD